MARGGFGLLCLLAVFSFLQRPGCCQYQQIVLGNSVNCNMSSVYTGNDGTSVDCTGAINGNNDTTWHPTKDNNPNCVFTGKGQWPAYWFLNLELSRTIHRITIYHVQYPDNDYTGAMRKVQVSVDGRDVFTYPDDTSRITNPTEMTYNFPVTGQIIKIERTRNAGSNYLPLCEVQIWECKRDRYGKECANTCSTNCQDNGGGKPCDAISGACNQGCVSGLHGPNCTLPCATNCEGECDQDNGECMDCKMGLHGNLCDKNCSDKCAPSDNGIITCRQADGRCTTGCKVGLYGSQCDKNCSNTCLPDSSRSVTQCRQDDGRCTIGCILGYYGVRCQFQCGKGCVNNNCNRQDGACACLTGWSAPNCSECQSGYYGVDSCEECGYCRDGDVCDNTNGHCPHGCRDHFDGDRCEKCETGYYGVESCEKCGYCHDDDACNNTNGHCPRGCRDNIDGDRCDSCVRGYYGVRCQLHCGKGCVNNNCHRQDGACACLPGWSSPNCTECQVGYYYGVGSCEECGHCLPGDVCDKHNGHCLHGCRDGFDGELCDRCNATRWSSDCSLPCGQCAGNGSCDGTTGQCVEGCLGGFEGDYCTLRLQSSSGADGGAIAGGVVAAVIVIAAAAVGAVFFIRRRRLLAKDSNDTSSLQHSDAISSAEYSNVTANKPKAHVKPLARAGHDGQETHSDTGPVYSNTSAITNADTTDTPADADNAGPTVVRMQATPAKPVGDRPAKSRSKPSRAPKPTSASGAGQIYENVSVTRLSTPDKTTEAKAPEAVPRKSGEGRMKKSPSDLESQDVDNDDVYNSEDLYASYKTVGATQQLDAFQHYLITCLGSGQLAAQFQNLPQGMTRPHAVGMTEENKRKNRFKALCTYDHNRVILQKPGEDSSDYINATYIKGCQSDKQYIATQGPRVNTIDDLWWMVWQERITQIVMLANLKEDGKDKCEEYWPASGKSQTYGHVTVKGLEEQQRANFVIRSFVLKATGNSVERQVTQYHYMAWPDHGVPLAASLVDYWRYVKGRTTSTVPLLVHCSAGVGRTGTFIALDVASEKESCGDDVNVKKIVTELREQRALMVQSEAQYKFLHEVILEAHTSRDTRVSVGRFDVIFPDTIHLNTDNRRIDKEFQMLNVMGQFSGKPSTAMATENLDKNRNMDALPDDGDLAYLSVYVRGRTQYINAVYLPSFHHRHGFILTQMPIPNNTLIDFWRLVDGCHVTKIVSLGSEEETETVKNYCQYWPHATGEVLNTGPYSIITNGSTRLGAFLNTYRLTVKRKTDGESRNVEVYHYRNWEHEVPSDTSSLLQLVDTVKSDNPNDVAKPIIIQCIDGVAKSGLFAVLCDVISRVTHDDEVDVYLNAREVQRIRPQAVATQTQYRYLYKAAQDYIGNLGVYANSGVK